MKTEISPNDAVDALRHLDEVWDASDWDEDEFVRRVRAGYRDAPLMARQIQALRDLLTEALNDGA